MAEVPMLVIGVWLYLRSTRALDATGRFGLAGLVAFLALVHATNMASPPPPDVDAIAWVGQAQWLLVLWAWGIDRHRQSLPPWSRQAARA